MSRKRKQENPLSNLVINIFLPVLILNQGAKLSLPWAAEITLVVALLCPIGYGVWDWFTNHHRNYISLIGIVNVLFTGGLALLEVGPFWFVIKEAFFPALLGCAVLISGWWGDRPFFETLMRNSGALHLERLDAAVDAKGNHKKIRTLFRRCNHLFASSFFISSALNFWLASRVFLSIPKDLPDIQRKQLLNEQIAEMTWKGWLVIALPLMVFMFIIFWYFFSHLKRLSGLDLDELTHSSDAS
jgi:hypothetical protein